MTKKRRERGDLKNIGIICSPFTKLNIINYQLAIKLARLPQVNKIYIINLIKGSEKDSYRLENNKINNYFRNLFFQTELSIFTRFIKSKEVKRITNIDISKINNNHIIPIFNVSLENILDNKFTLNYNDTFVNVSLDIAIDLEQTISFQSKGMNINFLLLSLHNPKFSNIPIEKCLLNVIKKSDFTFFEIYINGIDIRVPQLISVGKTVTKRFWTTNFANSMDASIREIVRIVHRYSKNENHIQSFRKFKDCMEINQNSDIGVKQLFSYYLERFRWLFYKIISYKYGFRVQWRTWYALDSYSNNFSSKIYEIKPKKGRFIADPNLFIYKNKNYILVEDCSIKTQKAFISCYEIDIEKGGNILLGAAIKEDFHLSFPFAFKYEDDYFMTVESSDNQSISLYKCNGDPLNWSCVYRYRPFRNSKPLDPLIWFQEDYWWLCFSIKNEMYLYYSDNPTIESKWIPHQKNPVLIDEEYCRNGGLIEENKTIYRVSQSSGFNNYGKRISLMKIISISPNYYEESKLMDYIPKINFRYKGIHTLSSKKKISVLDTWMYEKVFSRR